VRIEGIITQSGEMQIDGYICKDDLKMATSFKLDTGFIGYDVAIPADIAQKLSLRPSRDEEFITAAGRFRFLLVMMLTYVWEVTCIRYHT
jgi:predicted aspartyl protease